MFFCSSRSSEPLDSLGNMSKSDILRGIITEKLSTAAREILAVVERTVADYEEEASGFRREIERQKSQLELLQPHIRLERGVVPDVTSQVGALVREEPEEPRKRFTKHPGLEDGGRLSFLWYDDDDDDDDDGDGDKEDEEKPVLDQTSGSSRQKKEEMRDPDYKVPQRLSLSKTRPGGRRPGRPRTSDTQSLTHLGLRVRLVDSQTEVLSNIVFRKCPVQDLRCPRGLQEDDFLDLLRSTFPQLEASRSFDVLVTDGSRRLRPLEVDTLTPEEILRTSRTSGNPALYIRLKTAGVPKNTEDFDLQNQNHEVKGGSVTTSASQTEERIPCGKRRRGRPRLGEEPSHHLLRIFLLQDSCSDVLSETVLQESLVQDLECPRGLQEDDFVSMLRSAFPQLARDDRKFSIFKADRSRKLQKLKVNSLTPEEIYRTMKSTGTKKTFLYVRMKTEEEEKEEGEEEQLDVQTNHDLSSSDVEMKDGHLSSSPPACPEGPRGDVLNVLSPPACPEGPREDVPSTSSTSQQQVLVSCKDGDEDWKPDAHKQRLEKAEKSKTPCQVCGVRYQITTSLIRHAFSHAEDDPPSVCGVCGDSFGSSEELKRHLKRHQKTHDCSYCGKSFFTALSLSNHTYQHTGGRPFNCGVCSKSFATASALSVHHWVHVADKPHKCDICPRAFGLRAQLVAHKKMHSSRDKYLCNICGRSVYDLRSLTRHKLTHSAERRYGCKVCGKCFKLPGTLKSHEKIHMDRDRPFLCHICSKTFFCSATLKAHMKTHTGERPFVCSVCGKGCVSNGELKVHLRVHTGEAPYGCSECGRFFKLKKTLNSHIRSHLGIKDFVCGVCGKACARQEHLKVHMRTHNGERPYQCSLCEKAFTQSHCLKTHMKSHQAAETTVLDPSTS